MSIMFNSGSRALNRFDLEFTNQQLTMAELVSLRYKIDENFSPALAAELDALIDAAQDLA